VLADRKLKSPVGVVKSQAETAFTQ
jgi:hypothetical protein